MKAKRKKGQNLNLPFTAAFTLLEAMISVAIFMILMVAVAELWNINWRAAEHIINHSEEESPVDIVLKRLGEAMEASIYHQQPQYLYEWKGKDDGAGAGETDSVTFVTSFAPDTAEPSPEFAPCERILLKVERNYGKNQLIMRAAPFTMEEDDWQREVVLLEGIEAFRIRYWNYVDEEPVDGWDDDSSAPKAVQIGIALSKDTMGSDLSQWRHSWVARIYNSINLQSTVPKGAVPKKAASSSTNAPPAKP